METYLKKSAILFQKWFISLIGLKIWKWEPGKDAYNMLT